MGLIIAGLIISGLIVQGLIILGLMISGLIISGLISSGPDRLCCKDAVEWNPLLDMGFPRPAGQVVGRPRSNAAEGMNRTRFKG